MIDRERCRLDLLSKGLRTGKPFGEQGIKLNCSSTDSQGARVRRKLLAKSCLFKKRSCNKELEVKTVILWSSHRKRSWLEDSGSL